MANEQGNNPTTGAESDISKSQAQQQPPRQPSSQQGETGERKGQFESGEQGQQQFGQDKGQGAPDQGLQGDTATQQRTDIEGSSLGSREQGETQGGFVGSQGQQDSSSQHIEEEDEDLARDGQGAPEGK